MPDLSAEFIAARLNVTGDHARGLEALGVPKYAWHKAPDAAYGYARIAKHGRTFEISEDGPPAMVLITGLYANGTPEDLLAFSPSQPGEWYLRLGIGVYLNGPEIPPRNWAVRPVWQEPLYPVDPQAPLKIWRNPLNWLRGGCEGVVVLDWPSAQIDLAGLQTSIIAEDAPHGREIERHLRAPLLGQLPEILTPKPRAA